MEKQDYNLLAYIAEAALTVPEFFEGLEVEKDPAGKLVVRIPASQAPEFPGEGIEFSKDTEMAIRHLKEAVRKNWKAGMDPWDYASLIRKEAVRMSKGPGESLRLAGEVLNWALDQRSFGQRSLNQRSYKK